MEFKAGLFWDEWLPSKIVITDMSYYGYTFLVVLKQRAKTSGVATVTMDKEDTVKTMHERVLVDDRRTYEATWPGCYMRLDEIKICTV